MHETGSPPAAPTPAQLGRRLLRTLGLALGAEGGSVFLADTGGFSLVASLDPGHAPERLGQTLAADTPFGAVLATGAGLIGDEPDAMRRSGWSGYGSKSFLVVPVRSALQGGAVVALVALHDKREPPFSDDDLDVATQLTTCCAEVLDAAAREMKADSSALRLDAALQASGDALMVLDADQHVLEFNEAAEELLGFARDEIKGQAAEVLIPERFRDGHRRYFAERLSSGHDRWPLEGAAELRIRRADGTEFPAEVRLRRVDVGDGNVELVAWLRDISITRRLAERLHHRETELAEAQRLSGAGLLARQIAREVQGRLENLSERANAVLERVSGDSITTRHVEEIRKSSARSAELLQQLGSFAEGPSGEPVELDLNTVFSGFEGTFERLLGDEIRYETVLQPDLYRIRGDRSTLEHILANLALHFRDSLPSGTVLTLQTTNVRRPDIAGPDGQPRCEVHLVLEDDGPALTGEQRERLLGAAGSGLDVRSGELGLAVVFALVERSGGEVVVDWNRSRGTRFDVRLPGVTPAGSQKDSDFHDPALMGNETVLLVDEDGPERRRLATVLKNHRYKVIQAGRAEEALQLAEDFPDAVHMIVAHLGVPDMGGAALLERVQVIRPETVPLLSGTAALSMSREVAEEDGVRLEYPAHPTLFLRAVRSLLDRAPRHSAEHDTANTFPGDSE